MATPSIEPLPIMAPLICIVDDMADYRLLLQHLFSRYFPVYLVVFFDNGQTFLDQLPGINPFPSLILLDRHMPILDGHQTLLFLKDHPVYKKIPVVMMSTEASAEEINSCYETNVNSFLRKPIDFDQMKEQIEIVCRYWLKFNQRPLAAL